jgi:transposase
MTQGQNRTARETVRPEIITMETPEDVATMLRLAEKGWGAKRIAAALGCSKNTVKRYLNAGGYVPYAAGHRAQALDPYRDWLADKLVQHRGNAVVVHQELVRTFGLDVSLRTVERAVTEVRRTLAAETLASVRFETAPGQQMQADFGEKTVRIAGEEVPVHLCVLTLGYSRRGFVAAFPNEKQENWLTGLQEGFRHFGGVPREVLLDNPRALVLRHNRSTGELVFHERLLAFAAYWGFTPKACAPYRARTKGKVENGVGYVKKSALAGHVFDSWPQMLGHLAHWQREVADTRQHGTTGEAPLLRFERDERHALRPLPDKPAFDAVRELLRTVHNDACVEVETNWYSVPWRLLKATVTVQLTDTQLTVLHAGQIVAQHRRLHGRKQRCVDPSHWQGLVREPHTTAAAAACEPDELGRDLSVYEQLVAEEGR